MGALTERWTRCRSCGLSHSRRADGRCPRCRSALELVEGAGEPPPLAPAPSVAAGAGAGDAAAVAPAPAAAPSKASVLGGVGGVVGAIFGVAVSRYFGVAMIFPIAGALVSAVALGKLAPKRLHPLVPAAAVILGHMTWMAGGAVVLRDVGPVALDLLLLGAGVAWLLLRPGPAPLAALAVLQLVSLGVNVAQQDADAPTALRRALQLHVVLRLASLATLGLGWWRRRGLG